MPQCATSSTDSSGTHASSLDAAIGDNPVDISNAGDAAIKAQGWASHGRNKRFLRRTTDPNRSRLTYSDARQFLSNAGERLSTAEQMKVTPMAQRYLSQFASSLDDAIRSTAKDAGVLDDYTNPVNEYRQVMKVNDACEYLCRTNQHP